MRAFYSIVPAVVAAAALTFADIQPAGAKTLTFCSEDSPATFNPQIAVRQVTFDASSRTIYDRLVRFSPATGELIPSLAASWDVSNDGRRHVFHLRGGVAFHTTPYFEPTRPLNADDVVFSFNRQLLGDHPYHHISGGRYRYFEGMGLDRLIRSVTRLDELSVAFDLAEPNSAFPAILAMDFASILSAEYAEAMLEAGMPERVDRQPVGTGPFRFVQYQRDATIRYEAHPDYWAGKSPIETLVFSITPEASMRFQKLRSGRCQIMAEPDPTELSDMLADPNIQVFRQIGPDIGYLAFNTTLHPFDDPRVRRALALAIDRQAIVDTAYYGMGVAAASLIPPPIWPAEGTAAIPAPDPETARQLLAAAGREDLEVELWVMPVSRPYMPHSGRIAAVIEANWQQIGVRTRIVTSQWEDFLKRSMVGEHDAILFGWVGETADPDIFLHPLLSCAAMRGGANRTRWCDRPFDSLLSQARRVPDRATRDVFYRQALEIVEEQTPLVPLAHSLRFIPADARVTGFQPSILGGFDFYGVDLK